MSATSASENKPPILHIVVVGFHHKLGCQVEFSYPPLINGTSGRNECPSGWKYLPTLALPDGSHNFMEDTVFFNLPSLTEPSESVYGISCYRQIPVETLKIRTADMTRSAVQKSVCILSHLPIYGYIEVKLSLIADAFFEQGDFSCTDILVKAYQQLNACLLDDESGRPLRHFYVGLSLREIVLQWRHRTLILLKLFLLQRRVVCFASPVRGMCTLILGIASLVPRLLERGFQEVACVRTSRPLSPMPDYTDSIQRETAAAAAAAAAATAANDNPVALALEAPVPSPETPSGGTEAPGQVSSAASAGTADNSPQLGRLDSTESTASLASMENGRRPDRSSSLTRQASVDTLTTSTLHAFASVNPDEYRSPISIFASGNLCLPYLSLPYMDLLSDPSVLSYVIGTSNVLFQQKRQLSDVLVDIDNCQMETYDPELRRQLVLSTEDLRFMDFLLKHVQTPKEDGEGSEHWIREQFQGYILALLRTCVATDTLPRDLDNFNANFVQAFRRTQCFQEWDDVKPDGSFFEGLPAGHPFAGTLSVADMKLKLAQTMQNSESGRKLNQAVNTTSRAVGGALSQAKGAFSNWWSSITTPPTAVTGATGNDGDAATAAATVTATEAIAQQQPAEPSVTFQASRSRSTGRNEVYEQAVCETDIIEEAVTISINMESTEAATTNGTASERLVESAEELEEEGETEAPQRPPIKEGIVEIGHEAELLDQAGSGRVFIA